LLAAHFVIFKQIFFFLGFSLDKEGFADSFFTVSLLPSATLGKALFQTLGKECVSSSVLTRPLPLLPPPCTSLALYKRTAGRPAAASMPSFSRPTLASFSPCRRTSALRLFLGDVVRGSPAGHRSHAGDRVRTYVLAGSLCVRQSIALVRLSSIISRSRAAELSELCLHADAAESSRETSRQPHPADNPRASYYYGHRYIPP
jgi:hypothetical protein